MINDNLELNAIAAMSINRAIGLNNKIPWHLPEELAWFKEKTLNSNILMGRKTFDSIGGKPLPKRNNYVLSSKPIPASGAIWLKSIDEISKLSGSLWVCGGEQIYKTLLPFCKNLYITIVNVDIEADTFFPKFEHCFQFSKTIKTTKDFSVQLWSNLNTL